MAENKRKFVMSLTWHNCRTYPPSEFYNDDLIATDGYFIFPVEYDREKGWWNKETKSSFTIQKQEECYWADLKQTMRGCSEFKDEKKKYEDLFKPRSNIKAVKKEG